MREKLKRRGRPLTPWSVALAAPLALLVAAGGGSVRPASNSGQQQDAAPTTQPVARSADDAHLTSGLIGSKHDFSRGASGRDLCLPCHTPHLISAPPPRFDERAEVVAPLRAFQTPDVELNGWSMLCLGCHDGITAPDVYSAAHATTPADAWGNSRRGLSGLRSHPVGISYPANSSDFQPRAAVEGAGLPLPDGRIQCITCHDAHNTHDYQGFLKVSNHRSRLCLTCHRR
ncbi:MAG: hypothetical protein D6744_08435 [Planctomycetota bacterium]|nr:MAG: hypothetical protein D6744_08435 [Planctomycetota bacterium]